MVDSSILRSNASHEFHGSWRCNQLATASLAADAGHLPFGEVSSRSVHNLDWFGHLIPFQVSALQVNSESARICTGLSEVISRFTAVPNPHIDAISGVERSFHDRL